MRSLQIPRTCKSPMTMRKIPPIFEMMFPLLDKKRRKRAERSRNSPERMNGKPNPMQYPRESRAPRIALASSNASVSTAASAGPMQGVHPTPNANPKIGAPSKPPITET